MGLCWPLTSALLSPELQPFPQRYLLGWRRLPRAERRFLLSHFPGEQTQCRAWADACLCECMHTRHGSCEREHRHVDEHMVCCVGPCPLQTCQHAALLLAQSSLVVVTLALHCGFVLSWGPAGPLLWSHPVVTDPWPPIQLPWGPGASVFHPTSQNGGVWGLPARRLNPAKAEGMGNSCAG